MQANLQENFSFFISYKWGSIIGLLATLTVTYPCVVQVLEIAEVENLSDEVKRRIWNWIDHIVRKDPTDDCTVSFG